MATKPDENAGHGGSYVLDPKTGKRELVERTAEAEQTQPELNDQAAQAAEGN